MAGKPPFFVYAIIKTVKVLKESFEENNVTKKERSLFMKECLKEYREPKANLIVLAGLIALVVISAL